MLYAATIEPSNRVSEIVADVRRLTNGSVSISEIRDRLRHGYHVVVWDSNEYPPTMEREDRHAAILEAIRFLHARGYALSLSLSVSATDAWEETTLEGIVEDMKDELEYLRRLREEDSA